MAKETKQIGEVYVDSGLMWCGDPCYFWQKEGDATSTAVEERCGGMWTEFCEKIQATSHPHQISFDGVGVVVTSGMGDGVYPVYATIEDNTILSVTVVFVSDDPDEDEGE